LLAFAGLLSMHLSPPALDLPKVAGSDVQGAQTSTNRLKKTLK
jgi:hypothetical protein